MQNYYRKKISSNIGMLGVVCRVYVFVVTLVLWRGHTSNTSNMMKPTLVIITDRMSETQIPAQAVPVAPESEYSSASEKLAPPSHTSHSCKPRPILYPAGRDRLVVVTRHTVGYMQDSPA